MLKVDIHSAKLNENSIRCGTFSLEYEKLEHLKLGRSKPKLYLLFGLYFVLVVAFVATIKRDGEIRTDWVEAHWIVLPFLSFLFGAMPIIHQFYLLPRFIPPVLRLYGGGQIVFIYAPNAAKLGHVQKALLTRCENLSEAEKKAQSARNPRNKKTLPYEEVVDYPTIFWAYSAVAHANAWAWFSSVLLPLIALMTGSLSKEVVLLWFLFCVPHLIAFAAVVNVFARFLKRLVPYPVAKGGTGLVEELLDESTTLKILKKRESKIQLLFGRYDLLLNGRPVSVYDVFSEPNFLEKLAEKTVA